jgi:hypothetical protein
VAIGYDSPEWRCRQLTRSFLMRLPNATRAVLIATGLALSTVACAGGPGQAAQPQVEEHVQADVTLRGTVTAIDLPARAVTVATEEGTRVFPVDARVEGLERLRIGDVIDLRYHRSVLFDIQPEGAAEPGAYIAEDGHALDGTPADAARVGEQEVTVLAPVVSVDAAAHRFTVRGVDDALHVLEAHTPAHREALQRIKVGDMLRVRFREAVAVSVTHPKD